MDKTFLVPEALLTKICTYLVGCPYKDVYAMLNEVAELKTTQAENKTPVIQDNFFQVNSTDKLLPNDAEILQGTNKLSEKLAKN